MRRIAGRWIVGAVVATAALLVARVIAPGRRELELDVYVLALAALGLLALVSRLRQTNNATPSAFDRALSPRAPQASRVPQLERLERELGFVATRAFDMHFRLRPLLREIAAPRLELRGLRLDGGSPAVQQALGEELWELTRPEREPPTNRHAPGPGLEGVERMVEKLERL